MKIFEISISGSDSGGEGTIVHQIAVLAGYSDLNLNQLADEFLKTDCNRDETIFNDEGDNPNWWCYRPAHAEQFVEWLIQKKGFMRLNVESKDFGVIWPHEYCMLCYMHMFPDQPVARNYKTKEKAISDYVIEQFPQLKWIVDKKVSGGTSARRPDLLVDLGYQVVVIEIDEDQHKIYECICENKRAMEISLDLNHKPVIFIRFNPDGYTINGKKIPSCWVPNKMGILTVPQNKKTGWKLRLGALKDQIEYWTNPSNKTSKILEVVHLFYDL